MDERHEALLNVVLDRGGRARWTDLLVRMDGTKWSPDTLHRKLQDLTDTYGHLVKLEDAEGRAVGYSLRGLENIRQQWVPAGTLLEGLRLMAEALAEVNDLDPIPPEVDAFFRRALRRLGDLLPGPD